MRYLPQRSPRPEILPPEISSDNAKRRVTSSSAASARLIVEDHELHVKLLRDILSFYGYATLTTASGGAAIDIARQQRPDLILLDIGLPDIAGTEVAGRLKADPETRMTPIIAVTAFAMPGDRERCIGSGCDEYITKPVSIGGI